MDDQLTALAPRTSLIGIAVEIKLVEPRSGDFLKHHVVGLDEKPIGLVWNTYRKMVVAQVADAKMGQQPVRGSELDTRGPLVRANCTLLHGWQCLMGMHGKLRKR